MMQELPVLKYTHDPNKVYIYSRNFPKCVLTNLSVLASFSNLHELALRGILVESWEFAKHLRLKLLALDACEFPSLVSKCFASLEELNVYLHDTTNFVLAEQLDNLKTIKFLGETKPSLETLRSLSTSFPNLHVLDTTL